MGLENLKRLNVRVRPEMHTWLQQTSEARGLTMNAMIVIALETYFQQQTVIPLLPEMLEQLKREGEGRQ